jgi:restriction system protein
MSAALCHCDGSATMQLYDRASSSLSSLMGSSGMTMWLIRAGKHGEREKLALENQAAIIGWEELPDLSACSQRTDLADLLKKTYPDEKPKTLSNWESQLWPILDTIKSGDLVVLPLKSRSDIAIGRVTGPYAHRSDLPGGPFHTRPVQWIKEFPRDAFDSDLLYSFGAFMTVCRIERNNAEARVLAMVEGKSAKSPGEANGKTTLPAGGTSVPTDTLAMPDIEQQSLDLIRERIAQRFKGHNLALLVAAVMEAQGYRTTVSPPGADGGVDIMAGSGPLGFDSPRLVAQIKSQDSKVDVKVLRELSGVMAKLQAQHALLVGWGGFTSAARAEAAADYFRVRLWDAADVVRVVQEHYDALPEAIRAELPLKKVWTLVPEGPES